VEASCAVCSTGKGRALRGSFQPAHFLIGAPLTPTLTFARPSLLLGLLASRNCRPGRCSKHLQWRSRLTLAQEARNDWATLEYVLSHVLIADAGAYERRWYSHQSLLHLARPFLPSPPPFKKRTRSTTSTPPYALCPGGLYQAVQLGRSLPPSKSGGLGIDVSLGPFTCPRLDATVHELYPADSGTSPTGML